MKLNPISLKELKDKLKELPDDTKIIFGNGDLSFNRLKWRGDKLLQIEFNEIYEIISD